MFQQDPSVPTADADASRRNWHRRRGAWAASAAAVGLGVFLAASSSGVARSVGSAASSRADTLVVATAIPPASFDPIQSDNSTVDMVSLAAYDTLVQYNNQNQLVPDLATSYTTSANGKSISVTLRSGVKFQNGAPLTASDVAWTLNRTKKLGTDADSYISPYVSTTVVNPTHLIIHLSQPYTPFIPNLTRIYILNSKLVEQHLGSNEGQTWLATHDAGSGPYEL